MKKTLFGMIALLVISCTSTPDDMTQGNTLPKTPEADTNGWEQGPIGTGYVDAPAWEWHYDFDARVLKTICHVARVVPVDSTKWYDTLYVDLDTYGYYPEVPDSLWHAMEEGAIIPVLASQQFELGDEGLTGDRAPVEFCIKWWDYYHGDYAYRSQVSKINGRLGAPRIPRPQAVADVFYGN